MHKGEILVRDVVWYVARLAPLGVLFAAVYAAAQFLGAARAVPLAFAWERHVPLVEAAVWPYLSIFAVFWLPLFVLPRAQIVGLMWRYAGLTLAVGALFIVFPTAVSMQRADPAPAVYALLYSLDATANAAPSLHVAYCVLILGRCASAVGSAARTAILAWLVLIVLSTWLTHQHQLIDIVTGALAGGLAGLRFKQGAVPAAA